MLFCSIKGRHLYQRPGPCLPPRHGSSLSTATNIYQCHFCSYCSLSLNNCSLILSVCLQTHFWKFLAVVGCCIIFLPVKPATEAILLCFFFPPREAWFSLGSVFVCFEQMVASPLTNTLPKLSQAPRSGLSGDLCPRQVTDLYKNAASVNAARACSASNLITSDTTLNPAPSTPLGPCLTTPACPLHGSC